MLFKQSVSAYRELLYSGVITCSAEGEKVNIKVQGSVCGDVFITLSPKNEISAEESMQSLILSDARMETQIDAVFKAFRSKLTGLIVLPLSISWFVNVSISEIYLILYSKHLYSAYVNRDFLHMVMLSLPLLLSTSVTFFSGKNLGLMALNRIHLVIVWIKRLRK